MKKLFISFSAIILMAFSCEEKASVEPFNGNIVQVKSGQSFGMCIGKCYNELIVGSNSVVLKQIERNAAPLHKVLSYELVEGESVKPSGKVV